MQKKEIDEQSLGSNPFVETLSILVRKITKRDFTEDGVPKFYKFDLELTSSCRLYVTPEIRDRLSMVSPRGCQLLFWIMQKIEGGKDFIWIHRSTCMKELNISSANTYKDALKSLCDNLFIYPVALKNDVYWINPRFFFNGNRAKKFPGNTKEYVPKVKEEEDDEDAFV